MFMIAIVIVGVLLVPVTGGSLRELSRLRLQRAWLVFAGLALQLVITTILPDLPATPSRLVHLISYVFIGAFLVSNRHLPGVKLVILGTLLNFAAIAANNGTMPALPAALRTAGIVETHQFENSAPVRHAHLQVLGDDLAIPSALPLSNVFSVGDILILAGALVLVFSSARRTPESSPEPSPQAAGSRPD